MPSKITDTTTVEYVPFNFEGYIDSLKEYFGQYRFFDKWKRYWLDIFLELDEEVKTYITTFPNSNPIKQRISKAYEMFQVDHVTDYGTFTFHFDVEEMHTIKEKLKVPIGVIKRTDFYIDPDTPYMKEKLDDQRLPYFVRMAGIKESFIVADGNKRVRARIEQGERDFRGYIFWPEHAQRIFFGPLELYFYLFLYEMNYMHASMTENPSEANVLSVTQMHLRANAAT